MKTGKYKEYLESPEWAEIKNDLFQIRGRKCERCGSDRFLQIHHKTYIRIFNEEPSDLEILCGGCHRKEHNIVFNKKPKNGNGKNKNKKRWKKQVIPLTETEKSFGVEIITNDLICSVVSVNGGWSAKQLELLGAFFPPRKGWKNRIIGNRITKQNLDKLKELKDKHLKKH